jgi:hypothetical protein
MAENDFEKGKKAGGNFGYNDGKTGEDNKGAFEPTNFSEEYVRGLEWGYNEGHKLGEKMRKTKGRR